MKPILARDVLREKTAYAGGRSLASWLLLLSLIGSIAIVVAGCMLPPLCAAETFIASAAALAVANGLASIMVWYLVQAAFDVADAQLAGAELEKIVGEL